eukprot:TRINITY_DN3891_c0_g2_i1.p1 TRINITY_DN3891_c0_g2~~TRINITY_DN3891_c0_g2_i1.p1  ORF type:complete len:336 (+),score=115.39 TRINITY_DN3891_c0_g2_i1:1082-2089(+)
MSESSNEYTEGKKILRIASRGSALALVQTENVKQLLQNAHPSLQVEIKIIKTKGDINLVDPLAKIGDKGLFTKELEVSMLSNESDMAVHSLKDMPTRLPPGLTIGAITIRHESKDCLILHEKHKGKKDFSELEAGSVIGSSSLRRVAQLQRAFPHLIFKDVRGNLGTRLQKLDDGNYDGLILAVAGITRLGLQNRITYVIPETLCHHAVGQGALGIECREGDQQLFKLLEEIHHLPTQLSCEAERSFLRETEGGCQVPVGVTTKYDEQSKVLSLNGIILSIGGSEAVEGESSAVVHNPKDAIDLGQQLAKKLKSEGGQAILEKVFKTLSREQKNV